MGFLNAAEKKKWLKHKTWKSTSAPQFLKSGYSKEVQAEMLTVSLISQIKTKRRTLHSKLDDNIGGGGNFTKAFGSTTTKHVYKKLSA